MTDVRPHIDSTHNPQELPDIDSIKYVNPEYEELPAGLLEPPTDLMTDTLPNLEELDFAPKFSDSIPAPIEQVKTSNVKNTVKGAAGLAYNLGTGFASDAIIEHLDPNGNHEMKVVEKAGVNTALLSAVAPVSEVALPLLGAYEAGDKVASLVDNALPKDMNQIQRQTLIGAYGGGAAGLGFAGGMAATRAVATGTRAIGSAASSAISSISLGGQTITQAGEATEGLEMAEI